MAANTFLTAEWRKLAMANYAVDPALLQPLVPAHTELDLWNGTCYVSLVGFMFKNVKVMGMKIPFHTDFEEVNLRFYVKYFDGKETKRGVVFIREIVPLPAISVVANLVYNEHYATMPMRHTWLETGGGLSVCYEWKGSEWNRFEVKASPQGLSLEPGSEAEFITEHYWGYTVGHGGRTMEYAVEHPRWLVYPVNEYSIDVDFADVYGNEYAFLKEAKPVSVFLAEGSEIVVRQSGRA